MLYRIIRKIIYPVIISSSSMRDIDNIDIVSFVNIVDIVNNSIIKGSIESLMPLVNLFQDKTHFCTVS